MIFELRTYTFYPGKLPTYLHLARTVGRPTRRNDYGMCHGYWCVEFGTLDQVWHLWSYLSLDDRSRQRARLAENDQWTKVYGGQVLPLLQRQDVRFLNPAMDLAPPSPGGLFELRINRARPGYARQWLDLLRREGTEAGSLSPHVGLWTGEGPQPNEVVELLGFGSLEERSAYLATRNRGGPGNGDQQMASMLLESQSLLLSPTDFSPLQ